MFGRIDRKDKTFPRVRGIARRTATSLLQGTIGKTNVPGVGLVADITVSAFICMTLFKSEKAINENLIQKAIRDNEVFMPQRGIRIALNELAVNGIVEKAKKGYVLTKEMRELVEEQKTQIQL